MCKYWVIDPLLVICLALLLAGGCQGTGKLDLADAGDPDEGHPIGPDAPEADEPSAETGGPGLTADAAGDNGDANELDGAAASGDGLEGDDGDDHGDGSIQMDGAADTIDAGAADTSLVTPCPGGQPEFVINCSIYCTALARSCIGADNPFPGATQMAQSDACNKACTKPTWSCGTPEDTTGNTMYCRRNRAQAIASSPAVECPEAGPNSSVCR